MAGPSAEVLLPDAWTALDVQECQAWLAESLSPDSDNDWWVLRDPRHLGMSEPLTTGPILVKVTPYEEDDADETACVTRAAGFTPGSEIVLAAAVNGKDDHPRPPAPSRPASPRAQRLPRHSHPRLT
jgi:hypothetical protein